MLKIVKIKPNIIIIGKHATKRQQLQQHNPNDINKVFKNTVPNFSQKNKIRKTTIMSNSNDTNGIPIINPKDIVIGISYFFYNKMFLLYKIKNLLNIK